MNHQNENEEEHESEDNNNGDVTKSDNNVVTNIYISDVISADDCDVIKTEYSDVTTRGDGNDVIRRDDSDVKPNKRYKWYHINWNMLPTKLAYFCETGRRLGFSPNLALFLISIGLNKEESGFIVGLR